MSGIAALDRLNGRRVLETESGQDAPFLSLLSQSLTGLNVLRRDQCVED